MAKVGFKENDIIISYDKKLISDNFDLVAEMDRGIEKGICGIIKVKRDGKYTTLTCK
jgi:S1-C subfamily serine protease